VDPYLLHHPPLPLRFALNRYQWYNPILWMEREKAYPNGNQQKPIVPCSKQGGRMRP
jgi:hypothetical protein